MNVSKNKVCLTFCAIALNLAVTTNAHAAIALDRTRVVFNGADHSESLNITNQNKTLPYLAQAWVEDAQGQKLTHPLLALPPLQRVEPGAKSQIKIQATPDINSLPQDKESLFYFNVREIPPKSSKPNTLQIALQTRVKLFYRPASLAISPDDNNVYQKQITLVKEGDHYVINNPTGYFVTIIGAATTDKSHDVAGFKPVMIEPKEHEEMGGSAAALGAHPHLMFINDYGGRPQLVFNCSGNTCSVASMLQG
ncbi:fimbria/pilus periplasmic chaperone [uncultured Pluralibacter sp.]|uniref:fimbria/pilus periplasmic chaperone n=1 Tax=uncultured Pluralibacter sp. TaxID=1490864 RepID=UPI00262F4D8B|nr:fimbria/pilus periplasmic chaperone [uncultured Pluralibacter sp.]